MNVGVNLMEDFEFTLSGGHPNSLGRTQEVVDAVLADRARLDDLYRCYFSDDELVRLRVSGAMKRVTAEHPDWTMEYMDGLQSDVAAIDQASTQWTLALIFDFTVDLLSPEQRSRAMEIMLNNLANHSDWIVLNNSMKVLGRWAETDPGLVARLLPNAHQLTADNRKSVAKNARKLVDRFDAAIVIETVDPLVDDAVDALNHYFTELDRRFDTGFDPGDTTADAEAYRPPNGRFLLARSRETTVACGAVHRLDAHVAEIKRMWVDEAWRGLGIGRRMLEALEREARLLGCGLVRLDTNSALTEAIAMYTASGYRSIARYNDNPFARRWFEKELDRPS